jgi:hypothetical protein
MAKRSRLAARPGQRRPLQRPTARPAGTKPGGLTRDELLRAAELEAAIVAEERAADDTKRVRSREVTATAEPNAVGVRYSSTPLGVRAAEEYGYVRRDVRRIAIVGGFLIAILAVLEVLVNGMHLFTL